MSGTAYEWYNARFRASAEVAASVIEAIKAENDGICPPETLVAAAKPDDHPLHDDIYHLTDEEAAVQHRLNIARRMIRSIKIVNGEQPVFPFVHIRVEKVEGYVSREEAMTNVSYRESVLKEAKAALKGSRNRYGWLNELQPVWDAIDDAIAE